MSPRPRKVSNDEVFAAAHRAMRRLGPGELTLAEIAAEAGVTAGALVQRFWSKRGLLLALAERAAASAGDLIRELQATHPSPLAAVRAYGDLFARMGDPPGALAHHLGYLQVDLTDPEFHRHVVAQAAATGAELRQLLERAVAAGELLPTADPGALARAVQVTVSGSLLVWAFSREGSAARHVRADLDALLAPWTPPAPLATAPRPSALPAARDEPRVPCSRRKPRGA